MSINLHVALPTTQFSGHCRYNSGSGEETYGKIKFFFTTPSAENCYKQCKGYEEESNGEAKCVAFSFTNTKLSNCNLFKDGPYTFGDDVADTTCYIMGMFYYF